MSTLYEINVLEKQATKVKLKIQVVHPDSMYIAPTPGFALMLLFNMSEDNSPIRKEMDFNDTMNSEWMQQYARGYVKDVKATLSNEPPEDARWDTSHSYYEDSSKWLNGIMEIEVTHPAWIEHIKTGDSKDSADYDPCSCYDDCEPIFPADPNEKPIPSEDIHEAFLPVWKVMFDEYLKDFPEDIIWIPKYGKAAYTPMPNGIDRYDKNILPKIVGLYLKINEEQGIVIPSGNDYLLFEITDGSHGSRGFTNEQKEGTCAHLVFNKAKKRLAKPLSLNKRVRSSNPFIFNIVVNGDTAEFDFISFSDGLRTEFGDASEALSMLVHPIKKGSWGDNVEEEFPLGKVIMNTKKELDANFMSEVYKKLANGIIASYSVEPTESKDFPDLDAMSNEEIIKQYNTDFWPKYKAKIKVHDPAWLEHLKDAKAFSHGFNWEQPADAWTEAPLHWNTLKASVAYSDFRGADQPPRADSMNKELIRSMSLSSIISDEEMSGLIQEHALFLNTGGGNGRFEMLEAAGLPMNIYLGKSTEGKQLDINLKNISNCTVLKNAQLSVANMSGVYGERANFSGAIIERSMMTNSYYHQANFENANLTGVDLTGSDLREANFRNAILDGTDFEICDCSGADFTGAKMTNCSFLGAKIDGVKR